MIHELVSKLKKVNKKSTMDQNIDYNIKVRWFSEHSSAILSFINNTSAEIKTKSVDILLKMIIIMIELRTVNNCELKMNGL